MRDLHYRGKRHEASRGMPRPLFVDDEGWYFYRKRGPVPKYPKWGEFASHEELLEHVLQANEANARQVAEARKYWKHEPILHPITGEVVLP